MIRSKRILFLLPSLMIAGALLLQVSAAAQADKYRDDISRADSLMGQKKYEEALAAYKSALKDSRSFTGAALAAATVQANFGMSRAYLGLGAFKNAIQSCDDALKSVEPNTQLEATVRNQRGLALVAAATKPGDPNLEQAVAEFRKVLAISDKDDIVSYNLGVALLRLNKDAEGVHELQMYVARAGRTAEADIARRFINEPRRAREDFAPDFAVTTKDGEYLTLEELRGKVVLLDFWGTWCGPCRESTPDLVRYSKRHSSDVFLMISVAVSEASEQGWRDYIDKNKMNWPQYLDSTRKISSLFKVTAFPTYITIDAEGIIRDRRVGFNSETMNNLDDYVKKAEKLARTKPPATKVTNNATSPLLVAPNTAPVAAPANSPVAPSITPSPAPVQPIAIPANTPSSTTVSGGVTVRGRVNRPAGPIPQTQGVPQATRATLVKLGSGTGVATPPLQANINADGTFTFTNVQPGAYTASISIPVPTQQIVVGDTDINGLEFTAVSVRFVPVRVLIEGIGAAPQLRFTVIHPTGTVLMSTVTRPDGSIQLLLPEGAHRILLNVPGYAVTSLTYGAIDVLKDPIQVGNTDTNPLTVSLTANSGAPAAAPQRGAPVDLPQTGRGAAPPVNTTPPQGRVTTSPIAVYKVTADYTDEARKAHLSGTIELRGIVQKDGTLTSIEVVKGLGLGLDEAAVAALKKWRFQPATLNGQPVDTMITMTMSFSLK